MRDNRHMAIPVLGGYVAAGSTGSTDGVEVDAQGDKAVSFTLNVTEATGVTSCVMTLEDSDTSGSGFAACTFDDVVGATDDGSTIGSISTGTAVGSGTLGYSGNKRYVRATVDYVATDIDLNVINVTTPSKSASLIAIPGA